MTSQQYAIVWCTPSKYDRHDAGDAVIVEWPGEATDHPHIHTLMAGPYPTLLAAGQAFFALPSQPRPT